MSDQRMLAQLQLATANENLSPVAEPALSAVEVSSVVGRLLSD